MTKEKDTTTYPGSEEVYSRIVSVGRDLATSFGALVDNLPEKPAVPKQLSDSLGVDKVLSHRLLTALRKGDPLATAHAIPGPEPLLRVVRAARKRGVPEEVLVPAEDAATRFRDLIRNEAGDRSSLDAIISTSLPDARARFESEAKQLAYRGMRQLRGIAAEVGFSAYILHPQDGQDKYDVALVRGLLGLRCVRPGAMLRIEMISAVVGGDLTLLTFDGEPTNDPRNMFLPEFCSGPPLDVVTHKKGNYTIYSISWHGKVGLRSAGDIVAGEWNRNLMRPNRKADDPLPYVGFCDSFPVPMKKYVSDIILHDDVYPDATPRTRIYDIGELGLAAVNDVHRDSDILDVTTETRMIGRGIGRFRTEEIPNYVELLTHACTKLGWDPATFRCFRTKMDYPIHGTELQIAFELPIQTPHSK